jgi:hypothetical protein
VEIISPNSGLRNDLCEEVPRQNAAESRKIPESGSVIPREGVEIFGLKIEKIVIHETSDPERGS